MRLRVGTPNALAIGYTSEAGLRFLLDRDPDPIFKKSLIAGAEFGTAPAETEAKSYLSKG